MKDGSEQEITPGKAAAVHDAEVVGNQSCAGTLGVIDTYARHD